MVARGRVSGQESERTRGRLRLCVRSDEAADRQQLTIVCSTTEPRSSQELQEERYTENSNIIDPINKKKRSFHKQKNNYIGINRSDEKCKWVARQTPHSWGPSEVNKQCTCSRLAMRW